MYKLRVRYAPLCLDDTSMTDLSRQPIWISLIEKLEAIAKLGNGDYYGTSKGNVMAIECLEIVRTHLANQPPVGEALRRVKEALCIAAIELPHVKSQAQFGYGEDCVSASHVVAKALSSLPAIEAALNKPKVSLEKCTQAILISGQCPTMIYDFAENCARTVLNAAEVDYE